MRERYKRLYQLDHRLYASHAPVIIEYGSLLLEPRSNAMLCQLCFRNIQEKPVKSLRAVVQMLDAEGNAVGNPVDHRYLELDLQREDMCGQGSAIVLPSVQASSFLVSVNQVCFEDGEVWADADAVWEALPDQPHLEEVFEEEELERMLRKFGSDSDYLPLETGELWFCTCGAANHNSESRCHYCRRRRRALLGKRSLARRVEEQEDASFHAGDLGSQVSRRQRRGLVIGFSGLALLAVLALLLLPRLTGASRLAASGVPAAETAAPADAAAAPSKESPSPAKDSESEPDRQRDAYEQALALQEKADLAPLDAAPSLYEEAAAAFDALGDYEDSAARALQCRDCRQEQLGFLLQGEYDKAAALLEARRYSEAREAFLALGDYEDSGDQAKESVYRKALALYQYAESHSLRGVTAELSAEAGRESRVALPREQLLRMGNGTLQALEDSFGEDPVRFVSTEGSTAPQQPLEEAVAQLLLPLGNYRDSRELAARLPEMVDRSEEFFALCRSGDLEAARDWLQAWSGPFEDRELWSAWLEQYLPFCGEWTLFTGDPSLVSSIGETWDKVYHLRCQVLLDGDATVLRFLLNEGDDRGPELILDPDDGRFMLHTRQFSYLAQLNPSGNLSVIKIQTGEIVGGVEFKRS